MPDPIALPETEAEKRARIKQEAERQRQAIRANGIKEGYGKRDADWFKELGVKSMEEAKELFQLRQRPTISEERKHVRGAKREGIAIGMVIGAVLISAVWVSSMVVSFNQAGAYGSRMVVSGAALQAGAPPSTCIPGETLPDGRVCPMTTDTRVPDSN